jgi:hypothetical protein
MDIQQEWTVEAVLLSRTQEGVKQYLVKWEHWPIQKSSWEDEEDLPHCVELIREFDKQYENLDRTYKRGTVPKNEFILLGILNDREVEIDDQMVISF